MLGKRRGLESMKCLDGITDSVGMNVSNLRVTVKDKETRGAAVHGVATS